MSPDSENGDGSPSSVELRKKAVKAVFDVQAAEKDAGRAETDMDDSYMLKAFDRTPWIKRARYVSYVSIAFTLAGGIAGSVVAIMAGSSSLLGYALESFVDVWSSILVLWRFWSEDSDKQESRSLHTKEKKASVGIAGMLVVIGLIVGLEAIVHLAEVSEPNRASELLAISTVSFVFLSGIATIKWRISKALSSPSMKKDAVTSGAVAILSFGILLSAALLETNPEIWWLDSIIALLVSLFIICYGARTLIWNQWWKKQFWELQLQAWNLTTRIDNSDNTAVPETKAPAKHPKA